MIKCTCHRIYGITICSFVLNMDETMTKFVSGLPKLQKHNEMFQGIYTWCYGRNQNETLTILSLLSSEQIT